MKSFLSAVSTAFAVLFLAVSLSGCLGEEKAVSRSESGVFSKDNVVDIPKYSTKKQIMLDIFGKFNPNDEDLQALIIFLKAHSSDGYFKVDVMPGSMVAVSFFSTGGFSIEIPQSMRDRSDSLRLEVSQGYSSLLIARWKVGEEKISIS